MIKAAIITPNLSVGGAEQWVTLLLRLAAPQSLQWTGVAVSGWGALDLQTVESIAEKGIPIYAEPKIEKTIPRGRPTPAATSDPACERYIHRVANFREAAYQAARGADVVLAWGSPRYVDVMQRKGMPEHFVYCSHSSHHKPEVIKPVDYCQIHLVAVSEAAKAPLSKAENLPIEVIYNGASQGRLYTRAGTRERMREEWGAKGRYVIGYVGRRSKEKNPQAARQAVRELGDEWMAVYYGPEALQAETRQPVEPESRVLVYPATPNVADVYAGLDVLMLASRTEAFSLTMIEAWLTHVPVVSTPVGAVPELEEFYHCPLVCRVPRNPTSKQLADACRRAVSPEGLAIAEQAYEIADLHFTAVDMVDNWTRYFQRMLDDHGEG